MRGSMEEGERGERNGRRLVFLPFECPLENVSLLGDGDNLAMDKCCAIIRLSCG